MAEDCKEASNFVCKHETYKFEVMLFGFVIAPSAFQRTRNVVFRAPLFARVYSNDVEFFSNHAEPSARRKQVLAVIARADLDLKLSKCSLDQPKFKLLSYIGLARGICASAKKGARTSHFLWLGSLLQKIYSKLCSDL